MRPFTDDELARMRATQEASMFDECTILRRVTVGVDDYGQPNEDFDALATTRCGFEPVSAAELKGGTQVPQIDARLRLPLSLHGAFDNRDRIALTHRHGQELAAPVEYEIVGEPRRGPSGLQVDLKTVTAKE